MKTETAARKVTPDLMRSLATLTREGKTRREISEALGVSVPLVKKLRAGTYDSWTEDCLRTWQQTFGASDAQRGAAAGPDPLLMRPTRSYSNGTPRRLTLIGGGLVDAAQDGAPNNTDTTGEDDMLLVNTGLKPETRQHFKLMHSPFVDDVQSPDDVYQTPSVRYVRAALTDCALRHGFLAVIGESGAGKSTLAEDLHERIRMDGRDIIIIKPYVLGMEGNDGQGKPLKSNQIAEAIAAALDPQVRLKLSSEARFHQVHTLLAASRRSGHHHLLVIEEAHCLPISTLKHLKRFTELKDGMQRLLGVALIGQPELRDRLNGQNAEVREVAQRCELVTLEPLDAELEGYLEHKFARFNLKLSDVFAPDAFEAIRARLIHAPRGGRASDARSICYPLVVNNLVCRAMNAAAAAQWPQVDAQVIAAC